MSASHLSAWLRAPLQHLLAQRGHAWLLAGPSGLGQFELGLALVQAWLCDAPSTNGACGRCDSCRAVAARAHPDLVVLLSEDRAIELGWPLESGAQDEIDAKKRKPSREIRIDALRDMLGFTQRTSARGRGRAVLIYPAERLNTVSANALLKTLEEPGADLRFALASEAAHQLLPTLHSRCQRHNLHWPEPAVALAWLRAQGLSDAAAQVALRAAGGRPADALALHALCPDWAALPRAVQAGEGAFFKDWSALQVVDALHKLCHDMLCLRVGAAPRYFDPAALPSGGALVPLSAWAMDLRERRRSISHPFNAGLLLEDLLVQAQRALSARAA